ncbi:MAG: RNA methyltransferase, partial [Bacteroidota bacterium]|nr:RNA methyltransferase [Bacteroidota bacterium]
IRIADWFGIEQIICSEDTVELYNPKVIQSTMGSFVRTKVYYSNLNEFLKTVDVPVFGAMMKGENMYELQKPKEGLLVIGNEGKGIRNEILPFITNPITIPKKGGAESLNAAVAMGIILSHLV